MSLQTYHDKGAVEVEALATAFGHHEPGTTIAVLEHGHDEEQQVEDAIHKQEQQLATVVLPVSLGEVPRSLILLLIQIRRLQPVSSTTEGRWGWGVGGAQEQGHAC